MDNIETKMEMVIEHQIRDLEIQIEEEMKTVEQKRLTPGILIILRK